MRDASGPTNDSKPALECALVELYVVAHLEAADHVEEGLQRDALGIEQQLDGASPVAHSEDAQVAEHLALVGQEDGVAALPGP